MAPSHFRGIKKRTRADRSWEPKTIISELLDNIKTNHKSYVSCITNADGIQSVSIEDNIPGGFDKINMDTNSVNHPLSFDCQSETHDDDDCLNNFGAGMKHAAIAFCDKLTIYSKIQDNGIPKYWKSEMDFTKMEINPDIFQSQCPTYNAQTDENEYRTYKKHDADGSVIIMENIRPDFKNLNIDDIFNDINKSYNKQIENGRIIFTQINAEECKKMEVIPDIYSNNDELIRNNTVTTHFKISFDKKKIYLKLSRPNCDTIYKKYIISNKKITPSNQTEYDNCDIYGEFIVLGIVAKDSRFDSTEYQSNIEIYYKDKSQGNPREHPLPGSKTQTWGQTIKFILSYDNKRLGKHFGQNVNKSTTIEDVNDDIYCCVKKTMQILTTPTAKGFHKNYSIRPTSDIVMKNNYDYGYKIGYTDNEEFHLKGYNDSAEGEYNEPFEFRNEKKELTFYEDGYNNGMKARYDEGWNEYRDEQNAEEESEEPAIETEEESEEPAIESEEESEEQEEDSEQEPVVVSQQEQQQVIVEINHNEDTTEPDTRNDEAIANSNIMDTMLATEESITIPEPTVIQHNSSSEQKRYSIKACKTILELCLKKSIEQNKQSAFIEEIKRIVINEYDKNMSSSSYDNCAINHANDPYKHLQVLYQFINSKYIHDPEETTDMLGGARIMRFYEMNYLNQA